MFPYSTNKNETVVYLGPVSNFYDGLFCENIFCRKVVQKHLSSQKAPSQMFDRSLNTPLLEAANGRNLMLSMILRHN